MSQNRKKLAILGFLTDFGGQILVMLLNIFTVPLILKFTSQSTYGFWLASSSIIGFLSLTDFGIGVPLTKAIAANTDKIKKNTLNKVISTGLITLIFIGLIFLSIGLFLSLFISNWFNIPMSDRSNIIPAFILAIFTASIALPLGIFGIILNGYQKMAVDNTIRNLISIVCVFITIGSLYCGFGLLSIAISNCILILSSSLIAYKYVKKYHPEINISLINFDKKELRKLLKFSGFFQIGRIANTVATSADNIVIASVLGSKYVTTYSITSKLSTMFSVNIASKLPIAIFPAISQLFEENNLLKLQKIFIKLTNLSIRLAMIASSFVLIANKEFIGLWVGEINYGGTLLNLVFVYWILQDTIYRSTTAFIYASGDLKNWSIASIFEAILNLVISFYLAKKIGIIGVALGTSISKTITTGISTPYFICIKLKIPIKNFILKGLFEPMLKSLPGVFLSWFISMNIPKEFGWFWIIIFSVFNVIFNIITFEGRVLFGKSHMSFKERINKILNFE